MGQRGAGVDIIEFADQILDPNVLTLGFARRFTAYKRPNLLLRDSERFIQVWAQFAARPEIRKHVVFLEDYDIALAQEMVQGVDVWINTPRRPWEASGTSGMKVLANGGLNLSELDDW